MAQEFKEKTITVNLIKAFAKPRTKRTRSAMHFLKEAITKETRKTDIKISNGINEAIWGRGRYNCPRMLTVKLLCEKNEIRAYLPDEKIVDSKAMLKEKGKEAVKTAVEKEAAKGNATVSENTQAKKTPAPKAAVKKETTAEVPADTPKA